MAETGNATGGPPEHVLPRIGAVAAGLPSAVLPAHYRTAWLRACALGAVALPGLYAWGASVAWPAFSSRPTPALARGAALAAPCCLFAGLALARRRARAGRAIGVLGFVGLSAAAWGALGPGLRPPLLDPVRASLASLAWVLFALGWGAFPGRNQLPEEDPHALGGRLAPRARLPALTGIAFVLLVMLALALPVLAFRVDRPGVALLAQAVALAGSVGLLSVGSRVLLVRPGPGHGKPSRWALGLLVVWLLVGLLVWLV